MFLRTKLTSTSGIYLILSQVNGWIYVGSAINFKARKCGHFTRLRNNIHPNQKLQNHYNKYPDDLWFAIIEFCPKEKLIEREQYYIDTLKPEFNIRIKAESNFGLIVSEKSRQKRRESRSFPVDQYSLTGIFIKSYSSARYAGQQNKILSNTISFCINNKARSAGGFLWIRKGENIDEKLKKNNNKFQHLFVMVNQYSLKGEFISSYKSVEEATNHIGTSPHIMSSCICGRPKTLYGFIWKRA